MDTQIVAVFCLIDDMLKAFHHQEDPQCKMSDSELMTTAIVAALFFGGNYTQTRRMLHSQGYVPCMLSKSRSLQALASHQTVLPDPVQCTGRVLEVVE